MTLNEVISIVCIMCYLILVVDFKFKQHLQKIREQEKQKAF